MEREREEREELWIYCVLNSPRAPLTPQPLLFRRRVFTREEFAVWVCEQHNTVNEKLGTPNDDFSCLVGISWLSVLNAVVH
jgi:hypothetical protein